MDMQLFTIPPGFPHSQLHHQSIYTYAPAAKSIPAINTLADAVKAESNGSKETLRKFPVPRAARYFGNPKEIGIHSIWTYAHTEYPDLGKRLAASAAALQIERLIGLCWNPDGTAGILDETQIVMSMSGCLFSIPILVRYTDRGGIK
jgi:hypothetical protein